MNLPGATGRGHLWAERHLWFVSRAGFLLASERGHPPARRTWSCVHALSLSNLCPAPGVRGPCWVDVSLIDVSSAGLGTHNPGACLTPPAASDSHPKPALLLKPVLFLFVPGPVRQGLKLESFHGPQVLLVLYSSAVMPAARLLTCAHRIVPCRVSHSPAAALV